MLRPFRILSYLLIAGWAVVTVSSSGVKPPSHDGELGSWLVEFNHNSLQAVPPKVVLDAVKVPGFAKHLEKLTPALKTALVEKLVAALDDVKDLVKSVPDALVPYIPLSLLGAGNSFDLQELNNKPWTPEQAAMFFDDLIQRVSDFNSLSPSLLHGFTCTSASNMDDEKIQELAKAMKQKNVQLRKDQLSCLAKRLMASEIPMDFDDFPKDLFLFLSPSAYATNGSCKEFIARVGQANIEVLDEGSPRREQLLSEGLVCLNIRDLQVSQEDADVLGHLVCDLDADYLATSGQNLLKQLNWCQALDPDQIKAIRDVLSSGNTPFGPPSTWSSSTLDELSGLFSIFDQSILQNIHKTVLMPWLKHVLLPSYPPGKLLPSVVKNLQPLRRKRASGDCPPDKTSMKEMLKDVLLPILCTPDELAACLKGPFLLENLPLVTSHAFTDPQMFKLKQNLDQALPEGYTEEVLANLGVLLEVMSEDDIKKWNKISPNTFAALLRNQPSNDVASFIIKQYLDRGNRLDAAALNAMEPRYICNLKQDQLDMINEQAIKMARPLDLSRCSQATVDKLYPKAKRAFSDRHNAFPEYYNLIKPYLRGAPAEDLKALSKNQVNMDIKTLLGLKSGILMELTPSEVKGLLGRNAEELKKHQSEFPVRDWIQKQKQEDLEILGIQGGIPKGYITLAQAPNRKKRRVVLAFRQV